MAIRSVLFCALLLLSACGGGGNNCSFYGNCGCQDWYSDCSLH